MDQATINLGTLRVCLLNRPIRYHSIVDLLRGIGTIGHVAHGKSTVVKAISGVMTVRFKNELVRNITIKLGYANAKALASHPPIRATVVLIAVLDLQMRKHRLPATRMLPILSFRQGRQPPMRAAWMRSQDGVGPTRVFR